MGQLQTLELKFLGASPTQPRKSFNEKEMNDLTESVRAHGIIQPILVREWPASLRTESKKKYPAYEIIDGERRYRAAVAVGKLTTECLVVEMSDDEVIETQMVGFLHRADLHPMEEAVAFQKLLDRGRHSVADIAGKVGKSAGYVQQRIALNKLVDEAREYFEKDRLNAYQALLIARCAPEFQQKILKRFEYHLQNEMPITGRDVFNFIEENMHCPLAKAPFSLTDPILIPAAGPCSECTKRTANSATLFEDLAGADVCTDRPCYDGKVKAHLIQVKEEMQRKSGDVVTIATNWSKAPKGALKTSEYELASKGQKGAVQALVVAGDDLGKKKWVIPNKEGDGPRENKSREDRQKEIEQEQYQREVDEEKWNLMVLHVLAKPLPSGEESFFKVFKRFVDSEIESWDFDNLVDESVLDFAKLAPQEKMVYRLLDIDCRTATINSKEAKKFWHDAFGMDEKALQKQAEATVKERRKKAAEEAAAAPEPEPENKTKGAARRSKLAKKELQVA